MADDAEVLTAEQAQQQVADLVAAAAAPGGDVMTVSQQLVTLSVRLSKQASTGPAVDAQRAAVTMLQAAVGSGRADTAVLTWLAESLHTFAQRLTDDGQTDTAADQARTAVPAYQSAARSPGADILRIALNLTLLQKLIGFLGHPDEALRTQQVAVAVMDAFSPPPARQVDYQDLRSDLLVTLAARLTDAGQPESAGRQLGAAAVASYAAGSLLWNDIAASSATISTQAHQLSDAGFAAATGPLQALATSALMSVQAVGLESAELAALQQAAAASQTADDALRRVLAALEAQAQAKKRLSETLAKIQAMKDDLGAASDLRRLTEQVKAALKQFAGTGSSGAHQLGSVIAAGGLGGQSMHDAEQQLSAQVAALEAHIRFCGVPDRVATPKHEGIGGPGPAPAAPDRWSRGGLTVAISAGGTQLAHAGTAPPPDPVDIVTSAFLMWQAAGLVVAQGFFVFGFVYDGAAADITVSFVGPDAEPAFAGSVVGIGVGTEPGTAHVRLNASATWTVDRLQGVVLHEVGHVLGLHHDNATGSLMSPFGGRVRSIDDQAARALGALYA